MFDNFLNIFRWMFGMKIQGSGSIAKDRMKLMLVHDREQMPPEQIAQMKAELLAVMAKYFDIDTESADIQIQSSNDRSAFITTNVPLVKRSKFKNDNNYYNKNKFRKNKKDLSSSAS